MLFKKKLIIYISKTVIRVMKVDQKGKIQTLTDISWTNETFGEVLQKVKKVVKDSTISILLSEDIVYTIALQFPISAIVTREDVQSKAQELIPDNLNETVWDFKEMNATPENKYVQVIALLSTYAKLFSKEFQQAQIFAEVIEPVSYSLTRLYKYEKDPYCVIYIEQKALLILAKKHTIFATEIDEMPIDAKKIQQFVVYGKANFDLEVQKIFIIGATGDSAASLSQNLQIKVELKQTNPFISISQRKKSNGKDSEVLNLNNLSITSIKHVSSNQPVQSSEKTVEEENDSEQIQNSAPKKSSTRLFFLLSIMVVVWIFTGIFLYSFLNGNKNKKPNPFNIAPAATIGPSPIPSIATKTEEATISATPLLSKYSVAVLNGSTKAGEASKLAEILTENGFIIDKTGNADSNSYEKTEVHIKDSVPNAVKMALDKTLKNLYANYETKNSSTEETEDIIIIIGNQ